MGRWGLVDRACPASNWTAWSLFLGLRLSFLSDLTQIFRSVGNAVINDQLFTRTTRTMTVLMLLSSNLYGRTDFRIG
jgi:hypothetical protein